MPTALDPIPAEHRSTIPMADGFPLLGSAAPLLRDPQRFFLEQYQTHGPIYEVRAPGRRYVILAGPEASTFFRCHADTHFNSHPIYRFYGEDIGSDHVLISMDGEDHLRLRIALQRAFAIDQLSSDFPTIVDRLRTHLPASPSALSVLDTFCELASRAAGEAMTGCPFQGRFQRLSCFAHTFLGAGVGSFPAIMRSLPGYRRARREVLSFLGQVLDEAEQRAEDDASALPRLLEILLTYRKASGEPLSRADRLASLHMPFTNSLVYVGALAGFLLHFLLGHPAELERFRAVAERLFGGGRVPTLDEVLHQPRWMAALMETHRLQPISLSAPRTARRDFHFQGHHIRQGTPLLIATAVAHYLPEFYPDPEEWRPERFLDGPPEAPTASWTGAPGRPPEAFVPFGFDHHTCIAAPLVRALVLSIVGLILERFDVRTIGRAELRLQIAPFPAPHRSWKVHLRPRDSATVG